MTIALAEISASAMGVEDTFVSLWPHRTQPVVIDTPSKKQFSQMNERLYDSEKT